MPSTTYRTYYGYAFAHSGIILSNTQRNLEQALHRHLCVRKPLIPGYDALLRANQSHFLDLHKDDIVTLLHTSFGEPDWPALDMREEAQKLKFMPHPKRSLREHAFNELELSMLLLIVCWCLVVEWKIKLNEFAKMGKFGRIVVDLGVAASLQGAPWADYAKHYLGDKELHYNNCIYKFITSCDPEALRDMYATMERCVYKFACYVFSDDCLAAIWVGGKLYWIELDISSCDTSHNSDIFVFSLEKLFKCPIEILRALYGQIRCPIKILDPADKNKKRRIYLKPHGLYLQSGITITTLINCVAWLLMFYHISTHIDDILSVEEIVDLCADCGYIVTIKYCGTIEESTFLKTIPVRCSCNGFNGCPGRVLIPIMHPGVMLRCSGQRDGDLVKGSNSSNWFNLAALDHQSGMMNGILAPVSYPPWEVLNPKTHTNIDVTAHNSFIYTKIHTSNKHIFSRDDIYVRFQRRFAWTNQDIDQFEASLREGAKMYSVTYCPRCTDVIDDAYELGLPHLREGRGSA